MPPNVLRDERAERDDLLSPRSHQRESAFHQSRSDAAAPQRMRHLGMSHEHPDAVTPVVDERQLAADVQLVTLTRGIIADLACHVASITSLSSHARHPVELALAAVWRAKSGSSGPSRSGNREQG